MKEFCITFDVDLTDYFAGENTDELDLIFDEIKRILIKYDQVKTTWFIRIDDQIESLFGSPDYIFINHKEKLDWLTSNGHALGWHYHAYQYLKNKWVQLTDEDMICENLEKYSAFAHKYDLKITRMGWGFHTNKTLKKIYDLGFQTDSSAIPRPKYVWDMTVKDWENTPNRPYYPGKNDYRVENGNRLGILQIPLNTALIKASTDTEIVKRYINMAYKNTVFINAIKELEFSKLIVAITHPYELIININKHELLAFSMEDFELNIQHLINSQFKLINMLNITNK